MKFQAMLLAGAAMATFAAAVPQPNVDFTKTKRDATFNSNASIPLEEAVRQCGLPGQPCDMLKRAAFAINDVLKRHAESNALPCSPATFCQQKRTDLGGIASLAIDGYDDVVQREAQAGLGSDNDSQGPSDLIDYCDAGTTFCVRKRSAEPQAYRLVKRCDLCSPGHCSQAALEECHKIQQLHWRLNHPHAAVIHPGPGRMGGCGLVPGGVCVRKRDSPADDQEELMQPGGVADALYEIRDALDTVKREAEFHRTKYPTKPWNGGFGGAQHNPLSHAQPWFHHIEDRVDGSIHSIEA